MDGARSGLVRDAGRAMIAWAEALAVRGDATSASWLARAQTILGKTATWRDRIQLHRGFIARGRRIIDRVMSDPAASRVEAFERARGAAVAAIANAVDIVDGSLAAATIDAENAGASQVSASLDRVQQATFAIRASTVPAIVGLDRVARDLVDLVGAALVERERLHALLDAFSEIDGVTDRAELLIFKPQSQNQSALMMKLRSAAPASRRPPHRDRKGVRAEPSSSFRFDPARRAARSTSTSFVVRVNSETRIFNLLRSSPNRSRWRSADSTRASKSVRSIKSSP